LLVVAVWGVSRWWSAGEGLADGTWIELAFGPTYPEFTPDRVGLRAALGEETLSARQLHRALDAATEDPRILGILLRPDGFPGSWAQAQALRRALADARDSGVRVEAYVETPTSIDYYLASVAERITLAPEGMILATGLQARATYFRGGLDKIGARPDFVRVGSHKSAPETFERTGPSEASREQTERLLDDVFGHWIATLSAARAMPVDSLRTRVDSAPCDASSALELGWVDQIADVDELLFDLDPVEVVSVEMLRRKPHAPQDAKRVAVIAVVGTLLPGESGYDNVMGEIAGSDTIIGRLQRALDDDSVDAVHLRVDSPGGSALASDLVHRQVQRVREEKPVVVSMASVAASGGYYVAMGADRIVAEELTITGSIGVYAGKVDLSAGYEKLGISHTTFDRGRNAGFFSDLSVFSDAERAHLQRQLDRFYDRFVAGVAAGRDLDVETVERAASGRVWSGVRARELGLVDALGGMGAARAALREVLGVSEATPLTEISYRPVPSWMDRALAHALSGWFAGQVASDPLASLPVEAREGWTRSRLLWNGQVLYHLESGLRIR
jgi:protease-4